MKRYNSRTSMDEREKFRKFRELDDAFADALRALDKTTAQDAKAEEESSEKLADAEAIGQKRFEQRLMALMKDYRQPAGSVSELLETLLALGKIA